MSQPYSLPGVIIQQEFKTTPPGVILPQTLVIVGPNYRVFSEDDVDDRVFINYGAYDPSQDTEYAFGGLPVGAVVDQDSVKLTLEGVLAKYATLSGANVIERGAAANQVNIPTALGFAQYNNGTTTFLRNNAFVNRDVQIGDRVRVTAAGKVLNSRITGFVNDVVAATVGSPVADTNPASQTYATTVTPAAAGTDHVLTVNTATTVFAGDLFQGYISDVYVLEVIVGGAPGTAKFKVSSTKGDNLASVDSVAFGTAFNVGTKGLRAAVASAGSQAFVVGEKFTITAAAAYVQAPPVRTTAAGVYDGLFDTSYQILVVKGATWANGPQVQVTTSTGIDVGGPLVVAFNTSFPLGQLGIGVKFGNVLSGTTTNASTALTVATASLRAGMKVSGTGIAVGTTITSITNANALVLSANATASGVTDLTFDLPQGGLVEGDVYTVSAAASRQGAVRTAVLSNAIDSTIAAGDDLTVDFYIYKSSVSIPKAGYPQFSSVALTTDEDSFTVAANIRIKDASWTQPDGVTLGELPVAAATVIAPYRALVTEEAGVMKSLSSPSVLEAVLGKNIVTNPLSYGVNKALLNSGGQPVYWIRTVSDDLEGYQDALGELETQSDPYFRLFLSHDLEVLDLLRGHVLAQASAKIGNRCVGLISTLLSSTKLIYDKRENGDNWTGYVAVAPGSNPAVYTRVTAPGAKFVTDGVRVGDEFRSSFGLDSLGNTTYKTVKIVNVVDEENLILAAPGFSQAVGSSNSLQRIQVNRVLSKDEQATAQAAASSSYKSRRIYNVFCDFPIEVPHYFGACAVGGFASSVVPHQPITNYTVIGFSDHQGTQKRFTPTQLNTMAEGGTLILTKGRSSGDDVYIRHQISTDNTDDLMSELSVTRNVDSISDYLDQGLKVFVGKYNLHDNFIQLLDVQTRQRINNLIANTSTESAGPQIISWDPASLKIVQDPVARTKVRIGARIRIPLPANEIDFVLEVEA